MWIALAVAAIVALAALIAAVRAKAAARALGERVAQEIEPYLRRKAAEAGLGASAPVWTSRQSADDRVAYSADLAARLLECERVTALETSSTALALTAPDAGGGPPAPAPKSGTS